MMVNLIRAEWLKLARRPLAWVLLGIFLVQTALFISGLFFALALNDGIWSIQADLNAFLGAEQMALIRNRVSFPGIFGVVLEQVNGLGGIFGVILAAGAMGSEFNWGTLRVQLTCSPNRGRYLIAKIITLLLVILTGIVFSIIVGVLLGLLYTAVLGSSGTVTLRDMLLLPFGMLRALYIMLPYLLFTVAISILGRSVMAGVAGGIMLIVVDAGMGMPSFLAGIDNPLIVFFYNLLLQQNVNALALANRGMYGLGIDPSVSANFNPEHLPPVWQATLVLGIYSLVFFGYAYFLLTRRDVAGAT
jgi:ABC-type transport system involved in multi-copper enzyme maturation permease subunit